MYIIGAQAYRKVPYLEKLELYEELEKLATLADDIREMANQNKPVATKNAAAELYETIMDLIRHLEDGTSDDLE
jgi:hypothetical protein